jgi:acetyl esterase/lipase
MLDRIPDVKHTTESLGQIRAMMKTMQAQRSAGLPESPGIAVSERFVPGPEGAPEVRVLVYLPTTAQGPLPALLWNHGGGYVKGAPEQEDFLVKTMVSAAGCAVVSVDYRLAPETPHPGPVEDAYAALKWLYTHASELGVDPTRIAIGGGSAGAGLAAALGLLTRDRGEIPLVFQLLLFPMLDDRTVTAADPHPYTGEFLWTAQANQFGWTALLGGKPGEPGISPYAAAGRAENLAGLPPAFICVASLDLLLEEDLEYARRLMRAGVPTELHVYPRTYHGFVTSPNARVAQAGMRDLLAALKRALVG